MTGDDLGAVHATDESVDALAEVAPNDRRALERLLTRIHPEVARYCRSRVDHVSSVHSGEDVAQDVCLAVVKALPAYRRESSTFWAFVYGIASRKVADTFRSAEATVRTTELPAESSEDSERTARGSGPEETALRHEQAARMGRLLEQLPAQQRAIIVLRVQGGFSGPDTARILGTTPSAIRVAQHRALTTLRRLVEADRGRPTAGPDDGAGGRDGDAAARASR